MNTQLEDNMRRPIPFRSVYSLILCNLSLCVKPFDFSILNTHVAFKYLLTCKMYRPNDSIDSLAGDYLVIRVTYPQPAIGYIWVDHFSRQCKTLNRRYRCY